MTAAASARQGLTSDQALRERQDSNARSKWRMGTQGAPSAEDQPQAFSQTTKHSKGLYIKPRHLPERRTRRAYAAHKKSGTNRNYSWPRALHTGRPQLARPDRKGPTSPDPCARHKNCKYLAGCTNHAVIEILSWKEPFQIFAAFPWRAKTSVAASHAMPRRNQARGDLEYVLNACLEIGVKGP